MDVTHTNQRQSWLSWPLVMGCLAILSTCLRTDQLLRDADTLWHIRSGEWIWLHRAVPTTDVFSHTVFGMPWVSHEWLASLILFLSFEKFSWAGLVAISALAYGATVGLIARFLFQRLEPIRALFVVALVFASLATHLLARPHLLVMPLLAIWIMGCVSASEERRTPRLWLLPLMILWANLHGSFIVGLLLVPIFAAEAAMQCQPCDRIAVIKRWAMFGVLALLASLATPHHVHGLLFPFHLQTMTFATSMIGEWRAVDFQRFELQTVWLFGLFFLGWMLKLKLSLPRLALLAYLVYASLAHTRHLTLLAIIAPIILAMPFQQAIASSQSSERNAMDRLFGKLNGSAHLAATAVLALMTGWLGLGLFAKDARPPETTLPQAAIAFLKNNPQQGNVLNSYNFGGALIFSGIPVAIDGRADLYGDGFLRQMHEAAHGTPEKLSALLMKHQIAWTFFDPASPAVKNLDRLPGWKRIYADDRVVMHRQTSAAPLTLNRPAIPN